MPNIIKLIIAIVLCEGAGILGSVFTISAIPTWYAHLNKPFFSPPNFIFGPVWTILYFLMGVTLYLVWTKKNVAKTIQNKACLVFFTQLALNIFWSIAFFGWRNPLAGLLVIVALWVAIFKIIKITAKIDKTASKLLVPYLVWVSFATILNLSIVILNP